MLATGDGSVAAPRRTAETAVRIDLIVLAGLLAAALAVRLPYLTVVPRFRDETFNAPERSPSTEARWRR